MKIIYIKLALLLVLFGLLSTEAQFFEETRSTQNQDEFLGDGNGDIIIGLPINDNTEIADFNFSFSNSFTNAVANERLIEQAAANRARRWYEKQTELIKDIIEDRLNKTFANYDEARKEFFKRSELDNRNRNIRTAGANVSRLRFMRSTEVRKSLRSLKVLRLREAEIKNGRPTNSFYADIMVNNTPIGSFTNINKINEEFNKMILPFEDNFWRDQELKFIGDKIEESSFKTIVLDEATRSKDALHNTLDYWDKLSMMQFLLHYEQFKQLSRPPYILTGEAATIFRDFSTRIDIATPTYIEASAKRKVGLGENTTPLHPEYWKVIWGRDYQNSIFSKGLAIAKHIQLKELELERLIENTSIGVNKSVDYIESEARAVASKDQYDWLNANGARAIEFESIFRKALKDHGSLHISYGRNGVMISTIPEVHEVLAEIVYGGISQLIIRDLDIQNNAQKQYLHTLGSNVTDFSTLLNANKINGILTNEFKKFTKDLIESKRILSVQHVIATTGEISEELSACCPGGCCPSEDVRIAQEYGIRPIQASIDATYNIFSSSVAFIRGEEAFGGVIRSYLIELNYDFPSDITNKQLGEFFRLRKKNGIIIVELKPGFLRSIAELGLDIIDVLVFVSPSKGAGGFLAASGGRITTTKFTEYLRQLSRGEWKIVNENMSDAAKTYQEFISKRKWNESFVLNNVKFDGLRKIVLTDAKSGMLNFVNSNGTFKSFFTGQNSIINQARRQRAAAGDLPIEWHFEHEIVRDAFEKLLRNENLNIIFKHTPR